MLIAGKQAKVTKNLRLSRKRTCD